MRNEDKYNRLRQEAKTLLLIEGLTKKETAKRLKVMPKTITNWCNRYGWNSELDNRLKITPSANSLYDFVQHIKAHSPSDFPLIETLYKNYLNQL